MFLIPGFSMILDLTPAQLEASIQARNHIRLQQQAAAAGMQPAGYMGAPTMFYGPGQQPGFLPPSGRGMPFPPQQGMMPQGIPQGRGPMPQSGNFPPSNGGRGPMSQGIPQGMYGPPTMGPGGGPGGPGFSPYPNPQAVAAAQAQAQAVAATGRGRGGMPPTGMPGIPHGLPMMGSRGPAPTGRGAPRANAPPPQQQAPRQPIPAPQPVLPPSSIDINMFTSRSHQEQKQILGEELYPKIQRQHPGLAGKITGMLLEMENMELLALLVPPIFPS